MNKLFFFDLETTGVKYWKNGIHQISGKIVIDGETKEFFDFKVQPYKDAVIEDEALAVAGITRQDLLTYEPMHIVYSKLIGMLGKYVDKFNKNDKYYLIGFNNASFDNQFFRAFFVQMGDNYFGSWFWSDSHDVMIMASVFLKDRRKLMPNFKLSTVAKELGMEVKDESLHDAVYDIELTEKIYNLIIFAYQ
jgi:DNA polymerase-3 subunit epsilon